MRRVAAIMTVWLALVTGIAVGSYTHESGAASRAGWSLYGYREIMKKQVRRLSRSRPGVVWLGDSTMLGLKRPSYPQLLQGVLPDVSSRVIGFIGSDFYTYYSVVGAMLTVHRPAVLVTVAHMRLFRHPAQDPIGISQNRNDLFSLIPTDELPRAVTLPFNARGVSIPRLLLTRLIRYEAIERFFYFLQGAHELVANAQVSWLGPNTLELPAWSVIRALAIALGESNVPVTRDHPAVRMMEATVRLAREAGVHVVVVGTPLPFESMRATVGYDPALYDRRYAMLRSVVEDAGGVFVDLHEALSSEMFTDPVGHFTVAGAARLAEQIRPVVANELRKYRWEAYFANHPIRSEPRVQSDADRPG